MSVAYSYSHRYPAAERERPVRQLYRQDGVMPSDNAAVRMFIQFLTILPALSICFIGLECQWFSPLFCGISFPLFQAGVPALAAFAFWMFFFSRSNVMGLRWFSEMVHQRRFSALLLCRIVSIWSTTAPSKYSPQISGNAKATSRCTAIVTPFPSLYNEAKMYPVFLCGLGSTFICPSTKRLPPFGWFTYLLNERILPRFETSYKPSYPFIGLQISI